MEICGKHEVAKHNTGNKFESTDPIEVVKARNQKRLDLAFHPSTAKAEACKSLRNAQKFVHKHRLEMKDIPTTEERVAYYRGL